MKTRTLIIFLAVCVITYAGFYRIGQNARNNKLPHFYDGEGNEIPYHAVRVLVQSQFVHVSKIEQDTITKYFK